MKRFYLSVLSVLLVSTLVSAAPSSQGSASPSLFNAVLEKQAKTAKQTQAEQTASTVNTHRNEQYNSLSHAVLAKQGVKTNIVINSDSEISTSPSAPVSQKANSLFLGALAKQLEHSHH